METAIEPGVYGRDFASCLFKRSLDRENLGTLKLQLALDHPDLKSKIIAFGSDLLLRAGHLCTARLLALAKLFPGRQRRFRFAPDPGLGFEPLLVRSKLGAQFLLLDAQSFKVAAQSGGFDQLRLKALDLPARVRLRLVQPLVFCGNSFPAI